MPELLTTTQAAELLSMRPNALEQLRCALKGPRFIRLGKKTIRYKKSDIEEWVNSKVVETER